MIIRRVLAILFGISMLTYIVCALYFFSGAVLQNTAFAMDEHGKLTNEMSVVTVAAMILTALTGIPLFLYGVFTGE